MTGDKIKKLRKERGITQAQLADKLGMSQSTIGMIESGQNNGSTETLTNIAKYFKVPIDYLLSTEERLDLAMNVISKVKELSEKALSKPGIDFSNTIYPICSNFDGEKFTGEEQKEIVNFIKYVISKRKEND